MSYTQWTGNLAFCSTGIFASDWLKLQMVYEKLGSLISSTHTHPLWYEWYYTLFLFKCFFCDKDLSFLGIFDLPECRWFVKFLFIPLNILRCRCSVPTTQKSLSWCPHIKASHITSICKLSLQTACVQEAITIRVNLIQMNSSTLWQWLSMGSGGEGGRNPVKMLRNCAAFSNMLRL